MDPISAVSLAATILTFVDFSHKLLKGMKSIQGATGLTEENEHVANVAEDFKKATESLDTKLKSDSKHGEELSELAKKCLELSKQMNAILVKVRVTDQKSKFKRFKASFWSLLKEKDIARIEKGLGEYRQQIMYRLNLIMCDQQSSIKARLDEIEQQGKKVSPENAEKLSAVRIHLQQVIIQCRNEGPNLDNAQASVDLRDTLSALNSMMLTMPKEISVLSKLWFDSIHAREDSVDDPEFETFSWMLDGIGSKSSPPSVHSTTSAVPNHPSRGNRDLAVEEEEQAGQESESGADDSKISDKSSKYDLWNELQNRQQTSDLFLSFLRKENGVFFICGKAGSGKSTMMKFLGESSNVRVKQELDNWAGDKQKLVFVRLFFWNSGDKLQMSKAGFYRAVLFDILSQCPELIQHTFPDQWEQPPVWPPLQEPFRIKELTSAFNRLNKALQFPHHSFCFFIDGLDEFEGDGLKHTELARCLKSWAQAPNVKIICAARPHSEFLDTFNSSRTIQLHEFTRGDIHRYAQGQFESTLKSMGSNNVTPNITPKNVLGLVKKIVSKAHGVFLWAQLVVRPLVDATAKKASITTLNKMLTSYPTDLNEYFSKMLASVNSLLQQQSERFLLLAVHNPFDTPLNALVYSWIDKLEDRKFPYNEPFKGYSRDEVCKRHDDVRHQLDLLTKGLLEMKKVSSWTRYFEYRVEFFHRTVRDYLKSEWEKKEVVASRSWVDNPDVYARLRLAEAKFGCARYVYKGDDDIGFWDPLRDLYQEVFSWLRRIDLCLPVYIDESDKILFRYRCLLNRLYIKSRGFPEPDTTGLQLPPYWPLDSLPADEPANLLLLAALIPDPGLVQHLLDSGASPNDLMQVEYWTGNKKDLELTEITVWIAFLRLFALEIWKVCAWQSSYHNFERLRRYGSIFKKLLEFGADPNAVFLVSKERQLVRHSWELGHLCLYDTYHVTSKLPDSHDAVLYVELKQVLKFLRLDYEIEPIEKSGSDNGRGREEYQAAPNFDFPRQGRFLYGVASHKYTLCGMFHCY